MTGLIALAAAAVSLASADRHEGIYRFTDAPPEKCIERAREVEAQPKRPQTLGELPAAYVIRLNNDMNRAANTCFQIKRER